MRAFLIGEQTAKGEAATSFTHVPNVRSMNLQPNVETLIEQTIEQRLSVAYAEGGIRASGSVEAFVSTAALKAFLKAFFLKDPSTTSGDGYTEYTFTPWDYGDTLKYHTVVGVYDSNTALRLIDAAFDSLELSIEAGDIPTISGDVLAAKAEKTTPPTFTPQTAPVHGFHLGSVKIGGVAVKAKSVTLTMENNLADDYFLVGARELADLLPAEFNVEAEVEIQPADWSLVEQYLSQPSPVSVEIAIVKDENNEFLRVSFDAVITETEFPVEGAEVPSITVRLRAVSNLSVVLREPA
ncbi:MAG: hypothetical protein DRH17_13395 [Deltaproteobacteria bacterium]|nr:MAG: hypothetical protein DRH17_13395 [Deltaproteobacteria bacterium]